MHVGGTAGFLLSCMDTQPKTSTSAIALGLTAELCVPEKVPCCLQGGGSHLIREFMSCGMMMQRAMALLLGMVYRRFVGTS